VCCCTGRLAVVKQALFERLPSDTELLCSYRGIFASDIL
jgi:hypothetical protein